MYMRSERTGTLLERLRTEGNLRRKRVRAGLLGVALGLTVTGVASTSHSMSVKTEDANVNSLMIPKAVVKAATAVSTKKHWYAIGKASWYGGNFNGRKTASGEKYDMTAWTCAHRTLPLGSWVMVTNLLNKKSIFLRVNDRGPVAENLIVDLSFAAARKIGISGLGKVKIEQVAADDARVVDQMLVAVKPTEAPVAWPVAKGLGR